ncbi:hypothetical protein I553_10676, partial [Mycobacterium xenopi 4042]
MAPYTHICARCRHPITAHRIDPAPRRSWVVPTAVTTNAARAGSCRPTPYTRSTTRQTSSDGSLGAATAAADSDPSPLTVTEDSTTFCPLVFGGPADVAVVVS